MESLEFWKMYQGAKGMMQSDNKHLGLFMDMGVTVNKLSSFPPM